MNTKQFPFAESEVGTIYATIICVAASLGVLTILWRFGLAAPKAEPRSKPAPKPGKSSR